MSGLTLSLNAGSSSFKFAAFRSGVAALRGQIAPLGHHARLRMAMPMSRGRTGSRPTASAA